MTARRPLAALALACAFLWPIAAIAQDGVSVTTAAQFPPGTFLKNLSLGPDGVLLFTSYLDRRVLSWTGSGAPSVLARLDVHPVGILNRTDDIMETGCDGCTSVVPFGPGGALAVLTTGDLLAGGTGGARLLTVTLPK